ncbi:MAG TPA: hypothetical protein VJS37_03070, partial [Terriglobales bacterium]|nr:hypothetical protein [Terriglobales bacterium]
PRVAAAAQPPKGDDLQAAMDKLEESIHKPSAPFHASFTKSGSDGFSYECEADISLSGITGQQIDNNPATKIGTDVFPANTRTRQLNGTPYGSPAWQTVYGNISMAYLNGHIRDAQPGVKYVGDEQSGGYDSRHYDFDLAGVDADIKKAMEIGNSLGMRQTKDYNVKGSAWISKDEGRMVKFSFDNIYTFSDGKLESTHYEGVITKR